MFYDWNILKSIALMVVLSSLPITLMLLFGGRLIKGYDNEKALFITVGAVVAMMVVSAIILLFKG